MAKKKTPQEEYQTQVEELSKSFHRWHEVYLKGANDPFWPDGVNLNLIHNHILYHGKRIAELASKHGFPLPDTFDLPFPPEVDQDYMARKEEIRANALQTLKICGSDSNFSRVVAVVGKLKSDQKARIAANISGYISGLRDALQRNDYVTMRRFEDSERYLQSAKTFVEELKEEDFKVQLSLDNLFEYTYRDEEMEP